MEDFEKKFKEKREKFFKDDENVTLDKEFKKYSELHVKMVVALAVIWKPEILDDKTFQKINTYPELEGKKRVSHILNEICGELRGQKIYMELYELCWKEAEKHMDEYGCFSNRIY